MRVLVALLCCSFGASAQQSFVRDIWTDQKTIWGSPFRMNKRQFVTKALPLAAGTAALIATDRDAARLMPNTRDQVHISRDVSHLGDPWTLAGLAAIPWLARKDHTPVEALADSGIVVLLLKSAFGRERPLEGVGHGRFFQGSDSFPSGHAMMSFAVATSVARNRRTPRWLAVAAYTGAAAISLSRWSGQKHFPSDIFAGAIMGGFIGNYAATRPR